MAGIIDNFMKPYSDKIRKSFDLVKLEFEEHLDAINQNTNEIQHQYEIIAELENKMDSLAERIEHLELALNSITESRNPELNDTEKKIFLELYKLTEVKSFVELHEFEAKLGIDGFFIDSIINSMISKGVKIEKKIEENKLFYGIEKEFRDEQIKHNILQIKPDLLDKNF